MKLTQKLCIATTGVVMSLGLQKAAPVHAVALNFDWTGDAGYSAKGSFSYDETQGYTTIDTSKLQSITVSFFDPSQKLLNSFAPVTNGSIVYNFLDFNYDTATKSLFGFFDVGRDNGQSTDYYLFGTVGLDLSLRNPIEGTIDRNNGLINVTSITSIPEPLTTGGTVLTAGIAWLVKRRKVTAKKAKA
ncbi:MULTISPECIES: PEP-CTERM sorting domain-containing protein [Nostoc]|uniref:PEP-CTERM sorting domain-containing protein n=1 Tax=Nostoc paludosum FACHB-159 TaxID=2692908 RepID=A0ABR8KD24_9NOSO|nr:MULTISPECIES: PEP-CTERM sorting domain-containing protein [Nostoc]MBD2679640.1 PEP-CTERM sorting domain-containing protein [Nostoc sp. FACHB-857]MBD2736629.1 PEP-CTERM sorting domain-containing protein [Nostoc paludosum FACHB-159]